MQKDKISPQKIRKKRLAEWLVAHFQNALDAHEKLHQIIHLSESGISILRAIPNAVKALAQIDGKEEPESRSKLEHAEKEAALAEREIAEDFPVLHGLALVALWSWLENLVKGLLVLWVKNRKDAYDPAAVQKLRVKLGEFLQLSKYDQATHIIDLLEQETSSSLKKGVNRFEALLGTFGLSGEVPEQCSRNLFELQQIRNAIAHRNGLVDRRLKDACPWINVKVGQQIHINRDMLGKYSETAAEYLLILLYRVGDVYEIDLRKNQKSNPGHGADFDVTNDSAEVTQ